MYISLHLALSLQLLSSHIPRAVPTQHPFIKLSYVSQLSFVALEQEIWVLLELWEFIGISTNNRNSEVVHLLIDRLSKGVQLIVEILIELWLQQREFISQRLFALVGIDAFDLLSDEDELVGVGIFFDAAEKRVLKIADCEHLFFVACLLPIVLDSSEGVTYNRNEQVEEHNKVEDDAEGEDDPV